MESRVAQTHQTGHPRRWAVIALSAILLLSPGQTRQEQHRTSGVTSNGESAPKPLPEDLRGEPTAATETAELVQRMSDSARRAQLAARFDGGIIPQWALRQDAPTQPEGGTLSATLSSAPGAAACPPLLEFSVTLDLVTPHFDSTRGIWEIYVRRIGGITRHDIDSNLNRTEVPISLDSATPWIAADLDRDGYIELVSQWGSVLMIHSAPDWTYRAGWGWSGYNVSMHPVAVDIDDDEHLEIYVTPNSLGGSARAVMIDYDSVLGNFVKVSDLAVPTGAGGEPAVGDFDEDGRMEFISGNNFFGYELFEWQETVLVHIGLVGDSMPGGAHEATACRPMPGGALHALVGFSGGGGGGYRYQLLQPIGDNEFEVVHLFQRITGASGVHPCRAADIDCDGLDEMLMTFWPDFEVWEWDSSVDSFVSSCGWDQSTFGTFIMLRAVDLDQNNRQEFAAVNHLDEFYALPGPICLNCDEFGTCYPPAPCECQCFGDPICDSVVNVFDVVAVVDVAFRAGVPAPDPYPQCPYVRTDVNCDSVTNVFDVVGFVDIAFRSGDPNSIICGLCNDRSN